MSLRILLHFHSACRESRFWYCRINNRDVGKLLPLYFKYKTWRTWLQWHLCFTELHLSTLRKIWENLIAALDRKFLKPFPPTAGKCWHWPGGQFWNPVALVQTNSACSLGLLGTQTLNITSLIQISHLFIYLTKLMILSWISFQPCCKLQPRFVVLWDKISQHYLLNQ